METITKQKIGLFVITAGLGLGVITCNGNLFDTKTAKADPAIAVDANIKFDASASLRVDEQAVGIRFKAHMDKNIYNNFVSNGAYKDNVELGMIIIPQAAYDAFNKQSSEKDYFTFLKQFGKDKGAISMEFPASKIYKEAENDYTMSGVLDLAKDHYALKYQAVVYYSIDGGDSYVYSNRSDSRSFVCLADELLSSSTANLNDEQIKKLKFITNKYDVAEGHDFVDNVCTVCHGEEVLNFTSIDELNSLSSIGTATETVNVDLTGKTLEANNLTLGNKNIADLHTFKNTSELTEDEKEVAVGPKGTETVLNTAKKGQSFVIKGGTFEGVKGKNPNDINNDKKGYIGTNLPDGATLIFDGTTFKGALSIKAEWQQIIANGYNHESTYPHKLDKIILRNCTFDDGALFQNGGFARELVIDNCEFKQFNNGNDSNPMWFINLGASNLGWYLGEGSKVTIKNSTFTSTRPIKLYEQVVENASLEITNNTFNLIDDGNKKNDAIIFSTTSGESSNIKITGNEINGCIALMAFSATPSMKEGATFVAKDNILNGAKVAVKWKSDVDYDVDFAETDMVKVSSNDNLSSSISNALENTDSATISLAEGEFSLKETNKKYATDKDLTFIGKGNGKTIYKNTPKGVSGEANADYSFDGTNSITFRNVTIELGVENFNGFVRPKEMMFENCIINGMGSYWGTGKVTFKNCVFNTDKEYNLWLYSGNYFEFNNCTFNSLTGKFAHAYKTQNDGVTTAIFNNCKFVGTTNNKAAVNIKKYNGTVWNISMNDTTLEGVNCTATDKVSDLYYVNKPEDSGASYDYSELTVTVDNVLVWKGSDVVKAPTKIETSSNEELTSSITDAVKESDSVDIGLSDGNFSLKNDLSSGQLSGKTIQFVGNGENTVYGSTYTDGKVGEYGADYSLEGANVTFKNMTINLGEADYNGFVRATNLVFENCVINGRGSYWGQGGVTTFKKCVFNSVNGGYNIYTYSEQDYVFDGCTFNNVEKGKFFNVYKEVNNSTSKIEITNCTFNGSSSSTDKAVLCVKLFRGNNWNIIWKDNIINNVLELNEDSEFSNGKTTSYTYGLGYYKNIFGVRADGKTSFTEEDIATYSSTVISVDGVTRFENCQAK